MTASAIGRFFESAAVNAPDFWNRRGLLNAALLPFGGAFFAAVATRRALFRAGVLRRTRLEVPVVVVGNIVAGGGGKTPIVAALVDALRKRGMSPGIVARGFGAHAKAPTMVENDSDWRLCGDEALMLRRKTGVPVCVCADRVKAARALALRERDVVVSDDGLQHFALGRDVEVCAAQADYGIGNGWPLPAGPLREPSSRMNECDVVAVCGDDGEGGEGGVGGVGVFFHPDAMRIVLQPSGFFAADFPQRRFAASDLRGKRVAAFAGIARPARFFAGLRKMNLHPDPALSLCDHGTISESDLRGMSAEWILTTEKDAVKYRGESRLLALETRAVLPPEFAAAVAEKIERRTEQ